MLTSNKPPQSLQVRLAAPYVRIRGVAAVGTSEGVKRARQGSRPYSINWPDDGVAINGLTVRASLLNRVEQLGILPTCLYRYVASAASLLDVLRRVRSRKESPTTQNGARGMALTEPLVNGGLMLPLETHSP